MAHLAWHLKPTVTGSRNPVTALETWRSQRPQLSCEN
jgi:hypothetical protein